MSCPDWTCDERGNTIVRTPQVEPPWKWGVYTGKGVAEPQKPRTHEGGSDPQKGVESILDALQKLGESVRELRKDFPEGNPTEKQAG